MKKPDRKAKTGNPGKKRPRGAAPEDRPGGWLRSLDRESNAFSGRPAHFWEFVGLIALIALGLIVWAWRSFTS